VKNLQEWQQSNSIRAFPFSEKTISDDGIPKDFIVDFKFFPDYYEDNSIYLSSIRYNADNDSYVLEFKYTSTDEIAIESPSLARQKNINGEYVSRTGDEISFLYINSVKSNSTGKDFKYASCIFTVGKSWDTLKNSFQNLSKEQSELDISVINPGSKTFRRIFIDPLPLYLRQKSQSDSSILSIPPENEWGRDVIQKLKSGTNITFTQDEVDKNLITISANRGPNTNESEDDNSIKFINDVGADSEGKFKLNTKDCLTKIENPELRYTDDNPDRQTDLNVKNAIQLLSDCLPCCGCEKYRAFTAAIERRSRKLKEICDLLTQMVLANTELYNEAVRKINETRKPICRIRNLRVYENQFRVSMQNTCAVPIYIHFRVSIIGGFSVERQNFEILELAPDLENDRPPLVYLSFDELPPLPITSKDYYNTNPDLPSGFYNGYVIGSNSTNGEIKPILPGSFTDVTFKANFPIFDLRNNNLTIRCESNGIYGGTLDPDNIWVGTYGCKKDVWSARYEFGPIVESKSCGREVIARQTYRVVELET
jgi:hypothetical protein